MDEKNKSGDKTILKLPTKEESTDSPLSKKENSGGTNIKPVPSDDKTILKLPTKEESIDSPLIKKENSGGTNIKPVPPDDKTILKLPTKEESIDSPTSGSRKKFRDYLIEYEYDVLGSEADIFLVNKSHNQFILKLYRKGIKPPVIDLVKKIAQEFPEHVIQIEEFGFDEDTQRFYEIQEYARFGSLKDLIQEKKVSRKNINLIVSEIAGALNAIHEKNLIYRDLKPANLLVRNLETFDLILNDFGIACNVDPDYSMIFSELKGTINYWAPEQLSGMAKKATDYWALGLIILEIVDKNPFSMIDQQKVRAHIATKNIEFPKNIDASLMLLLKGLLTRDPEKRWGFKQVSQWLEGKRDIPEYYDIPIIEGFSTPYQFLGNRYSVPEDLIFGMISDEKSWIEARKHVGRRLISKWFADNGQQQKSIDLESIIENENDIDIAIFRLAISINKSIPFIYCGKRISTNNISIFLGKFIKKECDQEENKIITHLLNNKLKELYLRHLEETGIKDDYLEFIFSYLKSVSPKQTDDLLHFFHFVLLINKIPDFFSNQLNKKDLLINIWDFHKERNDTKIRKVLSRLLEFLELKFESQNITNSEYLIQLALLSKEITGSKEKFEQICEKVIISDPSSGIVIAYDCNANRKDKLISYFLKEKIEVINNPLEEITNIFSYLSQYKENFFKDNPNIFNENSQSTLLLVTEKIKNNDLIDSLLLLDRAIVTHNSEKNLWILKAEVLGTLNSESYAHWCLDYQLKNDPQNYSLILAKAKLLHNYLRYSDAEIQFDKIIKSKHNWDYYYYRAKNSQFLNRIDVAIGFINKAIEIEPENSELYNLKGNLLLKLQKINDAFENFKKSFHLNKNNSVTTYGMAQCYFYARKYEDSLKFIDLTLKFDNSNINAIEMKANILLKLKNYQESEKYTGLALQNDPLNPTLNALKFKVLASNKKYIEAIDHILSFHLIKEKKTNISPILIKTGIYLLHLGFYHEAITCLDAIHDEKLQDHSNLYMGFSLINLAYESGLNWLDANNITNTNQKVHLASFPYPDIWMDGELTHGVVEFFFQAYNKFNRLSPTIKGSIYGKALIHALLHEQEYAWDVFKKIKSPSNLSMEHEIVKSMLYYYGNNFNEAMKTLLNLYSEMKNPKILDLLAAIEYKAFRNRKKAYEYLNHAFKINPKNEQIYLHYGILLISEYEHKKALNVLQKVSMNNSLNSWGDFLCGYCQYQLNNYRDAELFLESSSNKNQRMKICWNLRAKNAKKLNNDQLFKQCIENEQKLLPKFGLINVT